MNTVGGRRRVELTSTISCVSQFTLCVVIQINQIKAILIFVGGMFYLPKCLPFSNLAPPHYHINDIAIRDQLTEELNQVRNFYYF